jgi:hypothetical protein
VGNEGSKFEEQRGEALCIIFAWPLRFSGSLQSKMTAELQSWVMAVSILKPNVLLLHRGLDFFLSD